MTKNNIISFEEFERVRKERDELTDMEIINEYLQLVNYSISECTDILSSMLMYMALPLRAFLVDYNDERIKYFKALGEDINDIDLRKKKFEYATQTTKNIMDKVEQICEQILKIADETVKDYKKIEDKR